MRFVVLVSAAAWAEDDPPLNEDVLEFPASIDPQGKPPLHTTLATVRRENGAWVYHGPPP